MATPPTAPTRRRRLSEDVPDPALVAQHTAAREEAFYAVHQWNAKPLLPMTRGRASQFYKLRAADDAPPIAKCLYDHNAFLGDALRILFLCSHEPEQWAMYRASSIVFLEQIEKWSNKNVSKAQETEAITTALRIFQEQEVSQAEIPPGSGPERPGE